MNEKTLTIINQIEQIDELAKALEILCDEWNIAKNIMLSINLVLEELISNIIFYGYLDKTDHKIIVRFSLDDKIFQIQIEDDAIEFNPLNVVKPNINEAIETRKIGGLGIHFARQLTDKITYERFENKNILTLTKYIT